LKKAAKPFKNSVVIGQWHKNASHRYKTAKIKIEMQRKRTEETT
jgi:hypothetical protein